MAEAAVTVGAPSLRVVTRGAGRFFGKKAVGGQRGVCGAHMAVLAAKRRVGRELVVHLHRELLRWIHRRRTERLRYIGVRRLFLQTRANGDEQKRDDESMSPLHRHNLTRNETRPLRRLLTIRLYPYSNSPRTCAYSVRR